MRTPYHLQALGYVRTEVPGEYTHPQGHPFYPLRLPPGQDVVSTEELTRLTAEAAFQAGVSSQRKHVFWAADETNCPRELKAPNGELHTLRCKVCGQDSPRSPICTGTKV